MPPRRAPGPITNALSDELRKLGWIEGTTIVIERKEAGGRFDRLPALAADLVRSKPDLIVAFAPPAVRAVKEATSEIPIVMTLRRRSGRYGTCAKPCSPWRKPDWCRHACWRRFQR